MTVVLILLLVALPVVGTIWDRERRALRRERDHLAALIATYAAAADADDERGRVDQAEAEAARRAVEEVNS